MVGALLLLVFLAAVAAMVSGRLPALLALPLLALGIGLVAGVPWVWAALPAKVVGTARAALLVEGVATLLLGEVLTKGVGRLAGAAFTVMLGGIFGKLLDLTGVAETLVRRVAELAGDKVFELTLGLTLTVALLFTALGGLGAVVMVGGIVFPVLLSLGVPPRVAGATFLMGFSFGGLFNLVNWKLYTDVLKLPTPTVAAFAARFGVAYLAVLLVFLVVQLRRARLPVPGRSVAVAAGAWAVVAAVLLGGATPSGAGGMLAAVRWPLGVALAAAALGPRPGSGPDPFALLAPLVPLVMVLIMGTSIEAAFGVGILYLLLRATGERGQLLARAAIEGVQGVAPAVCLMMGIGMVLVATWHASVLELVRPAVQAWIPQGDAGFVVFFALAAPLALYRGPLNVWGMGFGIAQILVEAGVLTPARVMVAFLADGQLQGVCDPTNTHNVWVAGQLRVELRELLLLTLPWVWAIAVLGLLIGVAGGA